MNGKKPIFLLLVPFLLASCGTARAETFATETLGVSLTLGMDREKVEKRLGPGEEIPIQKREDMSLFSYGAEEDMVFITYVDGKAANYATRTFTSGVPTGAFNWSISGIGTQSSLEELQQQYDDGKTVVLPETETTVFQWVSETTNVTATFDANGMNFLMLGDPDYTSEYFSDLEPGGKYTLNQST